MIRRLLIFIRNIIYGIAYLPLFLLNKKSNNIVYTECYMFDGYKGLRKNNWGDDLNKFLFEYVSKVRIVNLPLSKMLYSKSINAYSLIGSILSFYKLSNKIIYGTGVRDPNDPIRGVPKRIISVRGPLTRKVLLDHNIVCPENYGDPVLLLPCFYAPNNYHYKVGGLILNMGTSFCDTENIKIIADLLNLRIISMTDYNNWTDVIDEIASCDYIISESLHGLIVAETYGIPNVWVEFKIHPSYWDFKFHDFFESIKKTESIIKLYDKSYNDSNIELIKKKLISWKKGNIDYNKLLDLYPFDINIDILESH